MSNKTASSGSIIPLATLAIAHSFPDWSAELTNIRIVAAAGLAGWLPWRSIGYFCFTVTVTIFPVKAFALCM
jgi:hypothetical protein